MNILYIGDIMGRPGMDTVSKILPGLIPDEKIDFVIAQGENVTEGKGMSLDDMQELQTYGVNAFTGGNWSIFRDRVLHESHPVVRPANFPDGTPGVGFKRFDTEKGTILVISLLGKIVGKDSEKPLKNPLRVVDEILSTQEKTDAVVVNFHGDYSSEKRVIGYYLDGRASAVIGDHWHVPTADAMILPKGTAHITDVGMCGSLHSSLGIKTGIIVDRWKNGKVSKNELEVSGPFQFNALTFSVKNGLASQVRHIQRLI